MIVAHFLLQHEGLDELSDFLPHSEHAVFRQWPDERQPVSFRLGNEALNGCCHPCASDFPVEKAPVRAYRENQLRVRSLVNVAVGYQRCAFYLSVLVSKIETKFV